MDEENAINEKVLFRCHEMFRHNLDISELIPCLGKHNLLTADEREQVLINQQLTRTYKIDYFMGILPRKGKDWFEILITALKESAGGTGSAHIDLVLALKREKSKLKQIPDVSSPDNRRQPSKIANDTNWPTEKSDLNHLQAARSGSASPASRSPTMAKASRRNPDLQALEKANVTLKNQIKLVSLNESLIKHMKTFRDSLFILQSFYVEKFQPKLCGEESGKPVQLNEEQLKMARMIENITGCDKNFELVQEIDKWNKHLESLESNYAKTKEALFSLDDSRIKHQQLQLKLDGKDKEEFLSWIKGRESFVENGVSCFNELEKLTDEPPLIDDIRIRMEAGRELLNLWKDWMNLRASL